jgi:hypothetical protein
VLRGAVQRRLPFGDEKVKAQKPSGALLALRLLIVAVVVAGLVAAAGSGRAGTAPLVAATGGSSDGGSATALATSIAVGGFHGCAPTSTGGVRCWGRNDYGELGDGTTGNRLAPVDVSGLGGGVTAIATGWFHSCALTRAGGVKCWGWNYSGQLGDGTRDDRGTPVYVFGLSSGVTAISTGGGHSCALMNSGGVKCWGTIKSVSWATGRLARASWRRSTSRA